LNSEIVIIGGGIIGLYSAALLADFNTSITVIDQSDIGRESSWAAGGILSPLLPWDYDEQTHKLIDLSSIKYARLASSLKQSTGIDIEFWKCGLLALESQKNLFAESWCDQNNIRYSNTCPDHLGTGITLNSKFCVYLPEVAQVRSTRLIQAMYEDLKSRGVQFLTHTHVDKLEIRQHRAIGAHTSKGLVRAKHLVWATGAWGGLLKSDTHLINPPKITPVRGQIIAYDAKKINLKTILFEQGHYLIPRKDGLILAGSTLEHVGFDKSTTDSALGLLKQRSESLIPELAHCQVSQHWAGLRPYSEIERPLIGPHPQIRGLYLNCGHYRYGIAMAPRSAEIIYQAISETQAHVAD
jgi:glycine oxidase